MELVSEVYLYSVFENEKLFKSKYLKKPVWVKELNFFYGDLSAIDTATNSQFKEVKKKRKEKKFLGLCETKFPVNFPLKLNNGVILERHIYQIHSDSDETNEEKF